MILNIRIINIAINFIIIWIIININSGTLGISCKNRHSYLPLPPSSFCFSPLLLFLSLCFPFHFSTFSHFQFFLKYTSPLLFPSPAHSNFLFHLKPYLFRSFKWLLSPLTPFFYVPSLSPYPSPFSLELSSSLPLLSSLLLIFLSLLPSFTLS